MIKDILFYQVGFESQMMLFEFLTRCCRSLSSNIPLSFIDQYRIKNKGDLNHHFLARKRYSASYLALGIFNCNTLCQFFLSSSKSIYHKQIATASSTFVKTANWSERIAQSWFLRVAVVSRPLEPQRCHLEQLWIACIDISGIGAEGLKKEMRKSHGAS